MYFLHDVIGRIDLKEFGDFYGFKLDFDDWEIQRKYNIFRGTDIGRHSRFRQFETMNDWYSKMFGTAETMKYGLV